jgi:hypothetical protein
MALRSLEIRCPAPATRAKGDNPSLIYTLECGFSNRFNQARAIFATFCGAVPP